MDLAVKLETELNNSALLLHWSTKLTLFRVLYLAIHIGFITVEGAARDNSNIGNLDCSTDFKRSMAMLILTVLLY